MLPDRSSIDIQLFVFGGEDLRLCSASQSSSNPVSMGDRARDSVGLGGGHLDCTACSMYRAIRNHSKY